MLSYCAFFKKKVVPSEKLPLTLISLETWMLVKLQGIDTIKYLNNQFTCDVKNLNKNQYNFSAHCNAKGKMITNMYVFYFNDKEIAFIEPSNICEKQISIMKKYAIFSNITIIPYHEATLIGVSGLHARKYLNTFFKKLPDQINTVVYDQGTILLHFKLPIERFLLIFIDKTSLNTFLNAAQSFPIQYNNYYQWIALDIEAGYPCIDLNTSELFFPQAVNMDILKGISFNKGCYLGQELIARIQYHKLNKQSLYQLVGQITYNHIYNNQLPTSGDDLELYVNNQIWKKVGTILQFCQIQKKKIWVQAILNKSISKHDQIRIHNSQLNLYLYSKK